MCHLRGIPPSATREFDAGKANPAASVAWHRVCEASGVRYQLLLLAGLLLTGCATEQPAMQAGNMPQVTGSGGTAASALAFDAPITLYAPYVDISRDDRGTVAVVGYEEGGTSYYDIVTDNRQTTDGSDQFVRESLTERVGVTHR
jgi:hypothetical protein